MCFFILINISTFLWKNSIVAFTETVDIGNVCSHLEFSQLRTMFRVSNANCNNNCNHFIIKILVYIMNLDKPVICCKLNMGREKRKSDIVHVFVSKTTFSTRILLLSSY